MSGDSLPDDGDDAAEINIPTMDEVIAARKKRELARSRDDFIPLDPKAPTEPTSVSIEQCFLISVVLLMVISRPK